MGGVKRIIFTAILLSSVCGPIGTYFATKNDNSHTPLHAPQQVISKAFVMPTTSRSTTKFVSIHKQTAPPRANSAEDTIIYITPERHHGTYFFYNFTGQKTTYTGRSLTTATKVSNNYKFGETEYGILLVPSKGLDKLRVTNHIDSQKTSTARILYNRKPLLDLKTNIIDKKVLLSSINFSIRCHGLATCPAIDFYVNYKLVAKGKEVDSRLGHFDIYSMNKQADVFFTSWLFMLIVAFIIVAICTIITVFASALLPAAVVFFVSLFYEMSIALLFGIGLFILSEAWGTVPSLGAGHHAWVDKDGIDHTVHSAHPFSSIPRYFGQMNGHDWIDTTIYSGDILSYGQKPNKSVNDYLRSLDGNANRPATLPTWLQKSAINNNISKFVAWT